MTQSIGMHGPALSAKRGLTWMRGEDGEAEDGCVLSVQGMGKKSNEFMKQKINQYSEERVGSNCRPCSAPVGAFPESKRLARCRHGPARSKSCPTSAGPAIGLILSRREWTLAGASVCLPALLRCLSSRSPPGHSRLLCRSTHELVRTWTRLVRILSHGRVPWIDCAHRLVLLHWRSVH